MKIDKSFVDEILVDTVTAEITKAIISLGLKLGLKIIAEGVESKEQLEYLKDIGCEEIQGYLFSKPLDVLSFEKLLKESDDYTTK